MSGALEIWYQLKRLTDLHPIQIDGWIFRLHYWVTSSTILLASGVAFAKQYFGDPIECIFVSDFSFDRSSSFLTLLRTWLRSESPAGSVSKDAKNGAEIKAVDAYCWLHATVHLDSSLLRKLNTIPRVRSPCRGFPDLALANSGALLHDTVETLYYQWVPFFLLFQVSPRYEKTT